jgi:hypothetical protein
MKKIKKINGKLLIPTTALWILSVLILITPIHTTATPKQQIEREFRQLEAAISRCIHEEILALTEFDGMNRALQTFMLDNSGVVRIIRATVSGHTVNDVSAESPFSAPSRNVANQNWFKQVSQNKRAYYSMDRDSINGEISLFYAWPLMSGPERNRFSGAFAAVIDFTAQTALIAGLTENMPPFQIAFRDKPLFQHDWDDLDYNEEPLEVRGTQGLTIRTHKPMPTRLDPISSTPRTPANIEAENESPEEENATAPTTDDTKKKNGKTGLITNMLALILLAGIAMTLIYSLRKSSIFKSSKRFVMEDTQIPPPKPTQNMVIVKSMANMADPQTTTPNTNSALIDALTVSENESVDEINESAKITIENIADNDNNAACINANNTANDINTLPNNKQTTTPAPSVDHQTLSKMLNLIKEEFVIIDKKIAALTQRMEMLEKANTNTNAPD